MKKSIIYYSQRLTASITWLRFPLIFFIILLHCYSVVRLEGSHSIYFRTVYPFALWIGETGVPGFFFISGYLFFKSKKSYKQKLETRFHTLLIPYLLWNGMLLALCLIAYITGHSQDINHRDIADFEIIDYIRLFWDRGTYDNGNFVPILCPFWYIRNLLIMSVLSPIFFYIIRYVRKIFLLCVTIWWFMTFDNAFIPQTILFFCLGAYFSIHDINPLEMVSKNKKLLLTLFVLCSIADMAMHMGWSTPISLQVHRLSLIFNIPALLLMADFCVSKGISCKLLPNATFIVFAVHYPIVVALRKMCIAVFSDASDSFHILLYFVCVIISTLLSLSIYWLLDRYLPKVKNVLSGYR